MRIDKYLKLTRILKRRTIANDACDKQKVFVNDKVIKASYNVKIGDVIFIDFGKNKIKVRVKDIKEHVKKDEAYDLYEIL